jgi:hypothetical protein
MLAAKSCTTQIRSAANKWWRVLLVLLLIPIVVGTVSLARLPGPNLSFMGIHDGQALLTAYPSPIVDDESLDCGLLVFRTGRTIYLRASCVPEFSNGGLYWCEEKGDRVYAKRLDLESLRKTELGSFDGNMFDQPYAVGPRGIVAAMTLQNEICVIDLQSGAMTKSQLPDLRTSSFHFWRSTWLESPQRLLVQEESNGRTKGHNRVLLFSYVDGKLIKLAAWEATSRPIVYSDKLFSITIDHVLEVRQISDGALIESQPLAAKLSLPVPASAWPQSVWMADIESGIIHLSVQTNREILYDYVNQKVVWDHSTPNTGFREYWELRDGKALYVSDNVVEIRSLNEGAPTRRITFRQPFHIAQFTSGSERVCVIMPDDSVHLFDANTGNRLQSYRNPAWVWATLIACVFGFLVWAWLWVRHSSQAGVHPLWDVALLNGLALAGLLLPVYLQGSLRDPTRPIYQYLEAIAASWLLMLVLWFVFASTRWSIKVIAPILGLVGILLLAMFVYRGNRQSITELLIGGIAFITVISATFGLARRWGWQISHDGPKDHLQTRSVVESRIPLRDIFLVIAAAGSLFAVMRSFPSRTVDNQWAGMLTLLVVTTAVVAIGGTWTALSPRPWLTRLIVFGLLVLPAGSVHSLVFPQFYNSFVWMWQLRFAALVMGFSCASLLIFRVRGWRLIRVPKTS